MICTPAEATMINQSTGTTKTIEWPYKFNKLQRRGCSIWAIDISRPTMLMFNNILYLRDRGREMRGRKGK